MADNEETVGARIRRLREAKGWTQRQVAKKTSLVSYAYISRIESNERSPSIQVIRQIADVLDVNPVYLETGQMDYCPHCRRPM